MAVIKQGILGGFQNKIGNVVGTSWKGIAVMKSLPVSVANPRTAGQVSQRSTFKSVALFAGAILATIVKPLWDRFAQRMSGYNMFIQRNIQNFDETGLASLSDLIISSGKMSATPINSVGMSAATQTATIVWINDSGEGFKQATDTAFVVLYNPDTGTVEGFDTGIARSVGELDVISTLDFTAGQKVASYLAFRRTDGTIVSDTGYKNAIVGA